MENIQHPDITAAERTGYPAIPSIWYLIKETVVTNTKYAPSICPICLEECYKVYRNYKKNIVGCDNCITECDAIDADECFKGDNT